MNTHRDPHQPTLVATNDGSYTLHHDVLDEHYHSHHGALTESLHVFITHGLHYLTGHVSGPLHIFEMGFGTGLNAYLTYLNHSSKS